MKSRTSHDGSNLPSFNHTDKTGRKNLPIQKGELVPLSQKSAKFELVTGAMPTRKQRRQWANKMIKKNDRSKGKS